MIQSNYKLFLLIKSFSDSEIKELKKFISSPVYASRKNYNQFLDEIVRFNRKKLQSIPYSEFYSKLYPGKKFSAQTIKNRFSELFRLCEEFVVYNSLKSNISEKDKILLKYYLDNKLYRLFESKYQKSKRMVESMQDNEDKFREMSFLNKINLSLLNTKSKLTDMYRQFNDASTYTTCIALIDIFHFGIELKLQEYDNYRHKFSFVEELLKHLHLEDFINKVKGSDSHITGVVCMLYYLYKAYENPEKENYYFESRKFMESKINFFSEDYKNEIYKLMISYCIIRQNEGKKEYQLELFKIYNEKLAQGLYSEFRINMFPVNTFRDFVFIGIEIGKLKWVRNFIKKYSPELPEELRDDEVNLSNGKLEFSERHFELSLSHLNKVKGTNYLHYYDSSVLKLCCFFELGKYEESYFQIDKLRHYMRNHAEIPRVHRLPVNNFIRIYQKLLNYTVKPGKSDIGYLREEIFSMKFLSKRNWFLGKVSD